MDRAEAPLLEFTDAVVRRSGKDILKVDSFTLEEGESVALLGPNGAGKSTFVGLAAREALPLHRERPPVRFRGRARVELEEVRRALGVVSGAMQDQITVHLPAIEVVVGGYFGAVGVPKRFNATDAQIDHAFDVMGSLGLADVVYRDIMTLSNGQARRVLVARALVSDPSLLVFDEPCTGLDPEGMYHLRSAMSDLVRSGKSIMLVTHYPEDIVPQIGRVLLIKEGKVHSDGAKEEVLTDARMSELFGVPLRVIEDGGYYSLRP